MPNRHTGPSDIALRFWAKVDRRGEHECWEWTAGRQPQGYGAFSIATGQGKGKIVRAHRLAYELVHGPLPADALVRHACDNPPCVNPAHLVVGSQLENMADAHERNRLASGDRSSSRLRPDRLPRGERHWNARLSDVQVAEIRARRAAGEKGVALAAEYGVSDSTIALIHRGHRRRH